MREATDVDDKSDGPVPVYRPYLGDDVQKAATDALAAGWLGMGKLSQEFEISIERYLGLKDRRVVSTNSCTEALHLAGRLIGLAPGDEVICPSFTYVAGHQAISRTGAEIVFCDIEPTYLSIDPAEVRKLIGPRTKAILAVDYLGLPCYLDELMAIASEHGLRLIEDAAHAFGSLSKGRAIGSFGDITCFSFGPVKTITSLEGGAVITPDPKRCPGIARAAPPRASTQIPTPDTAISATGISMWYVKATGVTWVRSRPRSVFRSSLASVSSSTTGSCIAGITTRPSAASMA